MQLLLKHTSFLLSQSGGAPFAMNALTFCVHICAHKFYVWDQKPRDIVSSGIITSKLSRMFMIQSAVSVTIMDMCTNTLFGQGIALAARSPLDAAAVKLL